VFWPGGCGELLGLLTREDEPFPLFAPAIGQLSGRDYLRIDVRYRQVNALAAGERLAAAILVDPAWRNLFGRGRLIDVPAAITARTANADSPDWAIAAVDESDLDLVGERPAAKPDAGLPADDLCG